MNGPDPIVYVVDDDAPVLKVDVMDFGKEASIEGIQCVLDSGH